MYKKKGNELSIREVVERNTKMKSEEFLNPAGVPYIYGIKEAVQCLLEHKDEPIHIVGDYDADGITATTIMVVGLKRYGLNPSYRLPRRFSEGYGLSEKIIDEIEEGVIITVDNGIAALPAVKKAKEKGLTVIVTDHHLAVTDDEAKTYLLPEADVIVDPHIEDKSEFKDYCGAAIAYQFVSELLPERKLPDLKVLASIATVTDVMPLIGANRMLVQEGLALLNKKRSLPGLLALCEKAIQTDIITESDYGFKLGPIINASGRLYDNGAEKPLELFLSDYKNPRLPWKVDNLLKTNNERKKLVDDAIQKLLPTIDPSERPMVVYDEEWSEGIIGLIAGWLCERFQCPVIAFTNTEKPGILKASGRSIDSVHLKNTLDQIKPLLLGYGGHSGAAGLAIKAENLDKFKKAFKEACGPIPELTNDAYYDLDVELDQLDGLISQINRYAPYGNRNPEIKFRIETELDYGKYSVNEEKNAFFYREVNYTLVGYDLANVMKALEYPKKVQFICTISDHWYKGERSYTLMIQNIERI